MNNKTKENTEHDVGIFCEVYGDTLQNRIWEFILVFESGDFAVCDAAWDAGISRPKAYEIMAEFEKKGYVKKSRIIGRTQLYKLNRENPIVRIHLRNFRECLKMVIEEHRTDAGRVKENVSGKTSKSAANVKN